MTQGANQKITKESQRKTAIPNQPIAFLLYTCKTQHLKPKNMKSKTLLLVTTLLLSLTAKGQEKSEKLDFRIGSGVSLLGSGDMTTFVYENELNYKLNNYLTSAVSINLGRSNYGVYENSAFTQGNLNIFISPFKNNKKSDFRIGTGLSYYSVSDAYATSRSYENGQLVAVVYGIETRNSYGINVIIEKSSMITDKLFWGAKLYSQPYFNGDINTGLTFKLGYKI